MTENNMKIIKIKKNSGQAPSTSSGQVMMITVLVLSGVIIGAAAIAGILTVRQTRQTADASNSSKSVFAADAGLEWRLYKLYNDNHNVYSSNDDALKATYELDPCFDCPSKGGYCSEQPVFDGGPSVETSCSSEIVNKCDGSDPPICQYFYSFTISSTGSIKDSSYTFSQKINLIK